MNFGEQPLNSKECLLIYQKVCRILFSKFTQTISILCNSTNNPCSVKVVDVSPNNPFHLHLFIIWSQSVQRARIILPKMFNANPVEKTICNRYPVCIFDFILTISDLLQMVCVCKILQWEEEKTSTRRQRQEEETYIKERNNIWGRCRVVWTLSL